MIFQKCKVFLDMSKGSKVIEITHKVANIMDKL